MDSGRARQPAPVLSDHEDLLDPVTAWTAVELACRAPSVHHTRPWRWRIGPTELHLFLERDRRPAALDPDERGLLLSCGAAVHHLQVALRAVGWDSVVHHLPDPARPDHLAAVEVRPGRTRPEDLALAMAIDRRRTARRSHTSRPVPARLREGFCDLAAAAGTLLVPWDGPVARWRAARLADGAAVARALAPGAVVEGDGHEDAGTWPALLVTRDDSRLSRLRAGEALSAVLLEASVAGLAGRPVTQLFDVPEVRARVAAGLPGGHVPQAVLRLGWAVAGAPP